MVLIVKITLILHKIKLNKMSENKNNLPAKLNLPPEQLTPELIKAFFQKEISKKEYQEVLSNLDKIEPTKDNLQEVDKVMKGVNGVIKKLTAFAKETGSYYDKAHKNILAMMAELLSAITTKVDVINAAKEARNNELLAEIAKANAEKARIELINSSMTQFINNCTQFIATATTDKQITAIQKRIGSEKSREGFYSEFLDEFKSKCAVLDPLIKERKEYIKKMDELSAAALKAAEEKDRKRLLILKSNRNSLKMTWKKTYCACRKNLLIKFLLTRLFRLENQRARR